MLPILLDLGYFKIYTFGIFLVLAFFWGSFMLWKNVQLTSYKEHDIFDALFVSLISGLFFGRLAYVILHFNKFGFDVIKFILINGYPGINIYGGLAGAFFGFYLFVNSKKIKFIEIVDYVISPLFIALGFVKIGAFFSGAEVGTTTKFLVSVKYANYDGLRHLSAFYEGLLFLLGAYFAYKLLFNVRKQKITQGYVFTFFWWYTSLVIGLFSSLKANQTYVSGVNFAIVISGFILLTLSIYLLYYWRVVILQRLSSLISFSKKHGHKNS
jgi:phosphatidylglycerol:prolipoprotein diacylglycerol transferase